MQKLHTEAGVWLILIDNNQLNFSHIFKTRFFPNLVRLHVSASGVQGFPYLLSPFFVPRLAMQLFVTDQLRSM
jgi:hypothetical protein